MKADGTRTEQGRNMGGNREEDQSTDASAYGVPNLIEVAEEQDWVGHLAIFQRSRGGNDKKIGELPLEALHELEPALAQRFNRWGRFYVRVINSKGRFTAGNQAVHVDESLCPPGTPGSPEWGEPSHPGGGGPAGWQAYSPQRAWGQQPMGAGAAPPGFISAAEHASEMRFVRMEMEMRANHAQLLAAQTNKGGGPFDDALGKILIATVTGNQAHGSDLIKAQASTWRDAMSTSREIFEQREGDDSTTAAIHEVGGIIRAYVAANPKDATPKDNPEKWKAGVRAAAAELPDTSEGEADLYRDLADMLGKSIEETWEGERIVKELIEAFGEKQVTDWVDDLVTTLNAARRASPAFRDVYSKDLAVTEKWGKRLTDFLDYAAEKYAEEQQAKGGASAEGTDSAQ